MPNATAAGPARFRAVVLAVGGYAALAGIVTFVAVLRDGDRNRQWGWSSVRQPNGGYALNVLPGGPADNLLQTGDVVVAMNGDRRTGSRVSPAGARQLIQDYTEYSLTVKRDGHEQTTTLRPTV